MRKNGIIMLSIVLLIVPTLALGVDFDWSMNGFSVSVMDRKLLTKAQPDECFNGIGVPATSLPCTTPTGIPKVNEAYVWGLTKSGNTLYFGTAPNVLCLVLGGYLGISTPLKTDSFVCEFGSKDWRAPQIYTYDLKRKKQINLTETNDSLKNDPLLQGTLGIRSAGSIGDIVFLAGPTLNPGIAMYAFNAKTGRYLGSKYLPEYNNIRKWLVFNGCLYTAVGKGTGGAVLKWAGTPTNLWSFEEVGDLDSSGAELSAYGTDRIAVSTWPGAGLAGVFISPVVPAAGLTHDSGPWVKVWEANDYEPDSVVAKTYGGGSLAFFDGWLYWGTMHVPMYATRLHSLIYGQPTSQQELLDAAEGTHRAISIFRGRALLDKTPEIQLLYGEKELPAYDPMAKAFINRPTNMTPLYGKSGFGNLFNNYTWEMKVAGNQLFVGTMDWSYLYNQLGELMMPGQELPSPYPLEPIFLKYLSPKISKEKLEGNGADLWRFKSANTPAIAESFDGLGNYLNYGIRTMVVGEDNTLYVGTANPMNLEEKGGWELYQLKKPNLMHW